ncbi:MAG TPA: hypothetical protein VG722_03105 [Tepidisphaeraceae bacterium]|nr:hypothetical protein [Tepidisphaeraceae bacterium]
MESEIVSLLREIRDLQREQLKSHLETVSRIDLRQKETAERMAKSSEDNRVFREQVLKNSEISQNSVRRARRTTWVFGFITWAILAVFLYFLYQFHHYPYLP